MSLPINHNLLAEYKGTHTTYVESGVFRGDSLQIALDAGFETVYGIDIDPACIEFAKNRFDLFRNDNPNIVLICCDSAVHLGTVLGTIPEPCLIFLDSHWQMDDSDPGANPFPLMRELDQIFLHGNMQSTIIIDDFLYMSHKDITGWDKRKIEAAVRRINKDYVIEYHSNPIRNNILIAHV